MTRALGVIALMLLTQTVGAQFTTIGSGPDVRTAGNVGIGTSGTPAAQLEIFDIFTAGGKNLLIGNDAFFTDLDQANMLGLFGNQNGAVAHLLLGNNGALLSGTAGNLGINAASPVERLQIGDRFTFHDGGTKVLGFNFRWLNNADTRMVNAGVGTIRFGQNGDLHFITAPTGAAGSQINYPAFGMLLDNQGRLGIGGPPLSAQVEIRDVFPAGGKNLLIGDDTFFTDIDDGNVLGLYGNFDNTIAALKLGSGGPVLAGRNLNVGIETRSPIARLHVARSDGIIGELTCGDGSVAWTQTSNPTAGHEQATAAVTDDEFLYVAGFVNQAQGWRIEKRRKSDGTLVATFNDQPLPNAFIRALDVRGGTLYVVGDNNDGSVVHAGTDSQWIMEARDKGNGGLIWRQLSNPSPPPGLNLWNDRANAVVVDDTYIYVAGRTFGQFPGVPQLTQQWRIERRTRTTGSLAPGFGSGGIVEYPLVQTAGEPLAMKADGTDLYLAGYDEGWRVQKVDASGNSVWTVTSVTGTGPGANHANGLVLDGSSVYVVGYDGANGDVRWRIEKLDKSTGIPVNGFGSNGVVTRQLSAWNDTATGIASDPTGLLVSGWKGGPSGNNGWWIEKIDPTTGNTLTCFGTAGVVTHDPTTSSDEAYGIVTDGTGAYVYGRDMTPGNGSWRVYKLNTIGLQGFNVVAGGNVGIGTRTVPNILTIQKNSITDPIADAWTTYSSRRWKTDITPLTDALATLTRLEGVTYRWKDTGAQDIGLIAEDVGKVLPQIVAYEPNGKDAVGLDYARIIPILIQAIKEQQQEIDELRALVHAPR